MDQTGLIRYLGEDWRRMEAKMAGALSSDITLLGEVNDRLLLRGGKMLRPAVCLLSARACTGGVTTDDTIIFAASAQMLHNATLLHDDVVDNSQQRRGEPTVSSLLGGTSSVLIGDFWLVRAMELILQSSRSNKEVIQLFSNTLSHLAEGEMLQLQKARVCDTSMDDYLRIIYSKTASLFEATCLSAAISVDAVEHQRSALREYGIRLGLAFQIRDDILDYNGKDLGKPTGVDLREHKITLPLLGALAKVDDERNRRVRQMVCDIDAHPEYVSMIEEFVQAESGLEFAESKLEEFAFGAVEALSPLPDSRDKELLCELAMYNVKREI